MPEFSDSEDPLDRQPVTSSLDIELEVIAA